jgi:ATP-binding cassette subfamily B (MDR/TAP) protein 1
MTREEIMARVVDAAKMANAHDFIMRLPQQYDTDVGSNGMLLSGGQKQRIAIARALIKKPSVLLLDEATSALDAASERVVQQSIDSLASTKAQTIIVIAHRLSTIRQADKICVIQDGKIAEMGNHEQLLALNSYYADLVRLQIGDVSASASENVPSAMMESLQSDSESKQQQICDTKQSTNTASEKKDISSAAGATQVTPSTEVEELSKERSQAISRRIWGLIFRYPEWLCWGFLGALIFGGIFPWWGYMISVSQDVFYKPNPDDIRFEASQFGLFYILFAGVSLLSSLLQYGGLLGMGEKIAIYLRSEMFEALLRRDVAFFDEERNSVGSLTTALADDCRLVNRAFSESFARQMQAICNLAISLVLSFTASWKITLIILATFPLVVGSSAVQMQAVTASQYEDVNDDKPDANISSASPNAPALSVDDKSKSFHMNEDGQLVPTEDEAKRKKDLLKMTGGPGAIISTAFNQIRTVSAFSMHVHLAEQYNYLTQARSNARVERSFWGGIGFGGSNAIQFWIYALLFWYGAVLMRTEGLSFVNLMISIFALMMGALGLGQALSDMGDQKAAFLAADRIFRCIDEGKSSSIDGLSTSGVIPSKKEEPKSSEIAPRNTFGSRIEFKHVSFHYPTRPGIEVCRDYNFTIEAGETVAFVGPSGSGKSTIINLLLRFYDPNEGTIRLDGIDLRELNVRWIRSRCGYVGQEAVLFPGSVTDNIARGRSSHIRERMLTLNECIAAWEASTSGQKHASLKALIPCWPLPTNTNSQLKSSECEDSDVAIATDKNDEAEMGRVSHSKVADDVLSASRAAHAHDFIMSFPKQYETDVGEGSIMVSGGQKQRIAIARALIKQPSVLLLDEATSALDANSERLVQQSIDALAAQDASQRPTTIVIAHRLCTIRNADKICVVDQGEIVELGTHDELLSRQGGLYRQLWEKQQGHNSSPSNN